MTEATALVDVAVDGAVPDKPRIILKTDGLPPRPRVFALQNPTRLVIDLPELDTRVTRTRVAGDGTVARSVRVGRHAEFTRVVVDGGTAPDPFHRWRLEPTGEGWVVLLGEPATTAALPHVSASPPEDVRPVDRERPSDTWPAEPKLPAVSAGSKPTRIYGIELETGDELERILVFAERGVTAEVEDGAASSVVIDFPGTTLDPSAPSRIAPEIGRGVASITVFERADIEEPTVRVIIDRAGKEPPAITRRGAILAVEFARERLAESGVTLEFRDTDLPEVVDAIAEITGERFIYDTLQGAVTVSAGGRITRAEALELLHAALLMRGYAALLAPGGTYKILPIQAGTTSGPWEEADSLSGSAPVTTLVQLRSVSPRHVVDALRGWLGAQLIVLPYPPTNSVILSGSAGRLRRILTIIRALDESSGTEFAVIRLRHRDAADAASLIDESFRDETREIPEIFPDERTNALLIRATPARLAEVRDFLRRIDQPVRGGGNIHVLRLRAADPEQIAKELEALAAGSGSDGALADASPALRGENFQVTVDAPTRSLVIRSDDETFRVLSDLVAELDRTPARIRLEVLVFELTSSGELSLGFDAFFPISNPSDRQDVLATVLLNPSGGGLIRPGRARAPRGAVRFTRAPLVVPIVTAGGVPISVQIPRESFVITSDEQELRGRVLMRPNLLMVAGEEHELFAGANVPIPVERGGASDALAQIQTTQDIERQDVGLRVRVTPHTGEEGSVRLDLFIEQTSVINSLVGGNQDLGPSLSQRTVETSIRLFGDEYAIVALAKDQRKIETASGVPYLMNIPFLGFFFRSTTSTEVDDQFVVAVRARALRTDLEQLADSARQRAGFERNLARLEGLSLDPDRPFAVLVGTYTARDEATRIAKEVSGPDGSGAVVPWEWQGEKRFDVVLSPYATLSDAAVAVNALSSGGYIPKIISKPEVPANAAP